MKKTDWGATHVTFAACITVCETASEDTPSTKRVVGFLHRLAYSLDELDVCLNLPETTDYELHTGRCLHHKMICSTVICSNILHLAEWFIVLTGVHIA